MAVSPTATVWRLTAVKNITRSTPFHSPPRQPGHGQKGLRHPELKFSTLAHAKQLRWYVEFEFRLMRFNFLHLRPR